MTGILGKVRIAYFDYILAPICLTLQKTGSLGFSVKSAAFGGVSVRTLTPPNAGFYYGDSQRAKKHNFIRFHP
jgi:hypothetical protein